MIIVRALASATLLTAGSPVHAQTVDYSALEKLFGEPVTTSATGSPQRASETPASVEIITADDIRRSGAIDIPGVLRDAADIDILQWANDNADVSLRGDNEPYSPSVLVLIDGRQVYADYFGFTPWSALPVELGAIRQIEVVKGPNSALFGFNAAGGVINIITVDPLNDVVNTASLTGGTQGLAQGSAVTTLKFSERAAVRIEVGGRSDNDFSTPIPKTILGPGRLGNNRGEIDINGRVRLSDNYQFDIEASRTKADQNQIDPLYLFEYSRFNTSSLKGQLTGDTNLGLIQATAYSNWITDADATGVLGTLHFNNQVTVLQVNDAFNLGADHTLRGSMEYRHNTESTASVAGGNVFYDVFSFGGMWNWQITPAVSLTNALRLDHLLLGRDGSIPTGYPFTNADWNRSLTQISFNSGLVWRADNVDTLHLTASRGVQVPNLAYSGGGLVKTPFFGLTGVPTLAPTIVNNYEIDWDRALPSLGAHFRVTGFHQLTTAIASIPVGVVPTSSIPYLTAGNIGDSTASGVELAIKGTFDGNWRWGMNYRAEIATDDFSAVARGTDYIDFQHTTPVHLVGLNLGWARGSWEIDGYLRYQSRSYGLLPLTGQLSTSLTPIDGYASIDERIAYALNNWATISVSGQNLTQADQRQTAAADVERRVLGTVTVQY